jgi:hypothetical protein
VRVLTRAALSACGAAQSGAAALAALERDVEAALAAARAEDARAPRAAAQPAHASAAAARPDAAVVSVAVPPRAEDAAHDKWRHVARWAQRDSALAAALGEPGGPEDRCAGGSARARAHGGLRLF